MNKEARKELANKLTDAGLMEIQEMMAIQYRAGYEYAQFRASETAKLVIPDKPANEVLETVTCPMRVEELRSALANC